MRQVTIHNLSRPQVQPLRAGYCDSFLCRLAGLSFRRSLPQDWGLLLVERRNSRVDAAIHMFGVLFDLAVIWINTDGEVVDVKLARRWRPAYVPQHAARYILEATPDHLGDFRIGDKVRIEEARCSK